MESVNRYVSSVFGEKLPEVEDLLALPPGYLFLIHGTYRDVWLDSQLLNI